MARGFLLGALLLSMFQLGHAADGPDAKQASSATNAGLQSMKKLTGTWLVVDKDGKPTDQVVSVIKVTAGGSAVQETLFPGQPHEMVSLYMADGPDLMMTHYCVLGNQPRIKAGTSAAANKLAFKFTGGGNLDPKKDKHMHEAILTIADEGHFEVHGVAWEDGGPANTCAAR